MVGRIAEHFGDVDVFAQLPLEPRLSFRQCLVERLYGFEFLGEVVHLPGLGYFHYHVVPFRMADDDAVHAFAEHVRISELSKELLVCLQVGVTFVNGGAFLEEFGIAARFGAIPLRPAFMCFRLGLPLGIDRSRLRDFRMFWETLRATCEMHGAESSQRVLHRFFGIPYRSCHSRAF